MADQTEVRLSRLEFLTLARRAGFRLSEADLAQLTRRNLLRPVAEEGSEEHFHPLHVLLLVRYFEAVSPIRHPWATISPESTLQDINQKAGEVHDFVARLLDDSVEVEPEALRHWAGELRSYAEKINPFGPLAETVGLLGDDGLERLAGHGLRYALFMRVADGLAQRAQQAKAGAVPAPADEQPVDDAAADDAPVDDAPVADKPVDDESVEETPRDDEPPDEQPEDGEAGEVGDLSPESNPGEDEVLLTEELVLEEPSAESEGEAAEDERNAFTRDNSQATSRSQDLRTRLDQLRSRDKEIARKRGAPGDVGAGDGESGDGGPAAEQGDEPGESGARSADMRQRIEQLNRLREEYLQDKRWRELAELYEEGIDLFVDPAERQQVFLTLAMLYEVKLDEAARAFERFVAAYGEGGTDKGQKKALEGLRRLERFAEKAPASVRSVYERIREKAEAEAVAK